MMPSPPEHTEAADQSPHAQPGSAETVRNLSAQTLRPRPRTPGVLVADGEARIRSLLHIGLRERGFAVFLAESGQDAVQQYGAHRDQIDVVLLDVCLPGQDGLATVWALQAVNPQVRCCFLSADPDGHDAVGLRKLGVAGLFAKPADPAELAQALLRVVAGTEEQTVPTRASDRRTNPVPGPERRVFARRSCNARAYCQPGAGTLDGLWWQATVLDVSASGVRLLLGRRFTPGALVTIEFPGKPHRPGFSVSARVVHTTGEGSSWVAGCALHEALLSDAALGAVFGPALVRARP